MFIERVSLPIRQGMAALTRRTSSLPQSDTHLLNLVEEWRAYYHWIRPHQPLSERVSGEMPCQRPPAMALDLTGHVWTVEEFLHTPIVNPLARPDPSGPLIRRGDATAAA